MQIDFICLHLFTLKFQPMTDLEKLKLNYPHACYDDGKIYPNPESDVAIENEADSLIAEHYDDEELPDYRGFMLPVSGSVFVQTQFAGDYKEAFAYA